MSLDQAVLDKQADLAGPGVGDCAELERVDQWDWEKVITEADRNLDYLTSNVQSIWKVLKGAQDFPAIFIFGIGWPLEDGYPHEMRAAYYDDRVTKETLGQQFVMSGQPEFLELPYQRAGLHGRIPSSIGGGIGQSRTSMLLVRIAHLS